jgi:hypothetical protein
VSVIPRIPALIVPACAGSMLLCSVVGFAGPDQGRLEIVFLDRRGTFYPFAPLPGERRNNELELGFKNMAEQKLPIPACRPGRLPPSGERRDALFRGRARLPKLLLPGSITLSN